MNQNRSSEKSCSGVASVESVGGASYADAFVAICGSGWFVPNLTGGPECGTCGYGWGSDARSRGYADGSGEVVLSFEIKVSRFMFIVNDRICRVIMLLILLFFGWKDFTGYFLSLAD